MTSSMTQNVQHLEAGGSGSPVPGPSSGHPKQPYFSGSTSTHLGPISRVGGGGYEPESENVPLVGQVRIPSSRKRSGDENSKGRKFVKTQDSSSGASRQVAPPKDVSLVHIDDDDDDDVQFIDSVAGTARPQSLVSLTDFLQDRGNMEPHLNRLYSPNTMVRLTNWQTVYMIYDDSLPLGWLKRLEGSNGDFVVTFKSPDGHFLNNFNEVVHYLNSNGLRLSLDAFNFNGHASISRSAKILSYSTWDQGHQQTQNPQSAY